MEERSGLTVANLVGIVPYAGENEAGENEKHSVLA